MVFRSRWSVRQNKQPRALPLSIGVSIQLTLVQLSGSMAVAQLIPDTASDRTLNTTVEQLTPGTDRITGGARRGANLFHSFLEFNVNQEQRVYFANPTGVENIFSRVTGRNVSNILGTLGVEGGANLFLLNPNGILFGPNTRLDIRGSFVASTANSFKFADGTEFSATNPQAPPLLTVNLTPGLQYGSISQGSTIVNRGNLNAEQNLTLVGDRLDLQGQLQAGRDLTLQAQDTVQIRDTAISPFVAVAGNRLLMQGDRSVDIFTLNHPSSRFWSGGNLVLRSNNPIIGDAHFYAGRNLQVEKLNGTPGNLLSPNDPVILANGNVSLGDYFGGSLHILAGGSVTLGNITIDSTGETTTTINPNNTTPFNATKTFADLATVTLRDYQPIYNTDGSVQNVVPVQTNITIDGSSQATLDVRAGVDWAQLGGLPTSTTNLGTVIPKPEYAGIPERADITVTGNIRVSQPSGLVLLTNQFYPNGLEGTISPQGIDTSTDVAGANGGDIRLYGRGDITLSGSLSNPILLYSSSSSSSSPSGNGGNISLSTYSGNIALINSSLYSGSYSFVSLDVSASGRGGNISLSSYSGDISLFNSPSRLSFYPSLNSFSYAESYGGSSVSGRGGDISLTTYAGGISLSLIEAYSYSYSKSDSSSSLDSSVSGRGGDISLSTYSGAVSLLQSYLNSYSESNSFAYSGPSISGQGGDISLSTHSGNLSITNSYLVSSSTSSSTSMLDLSTSGRGGDISLSTYSGDISLINSASNSFSSSSASSYSVPGYSTSYSGPSTSGRGGDISLSTYSGDIALINSNLYSSSGSSSNANSYPNSYAPTYSGSSSSGRGGDITLTTSSGDISLFDSNLFSGSGSNSDANPDLYSLPLSYSGPSISGSGGEIAFTTYSGDISLNNSNLNSGSSSYSDLESDNPFVYPYSDLSVSGHGGNISLSTYSGNLFLFSSNLSSYSSSSSSSGPSISGSGGEIALTTYSGNIISSESSLSAFTVATDDSQDSGNGGNVSLTARNQISSLEIFTQSSSGTAGAVNINGTGNLTFTNLEISTSKTVAIKNPITGETITFAPGEKGRSGEVTIVGAGNLTFDGTLIQSTAQGIDPAGGVQITSPGVVTFNNSQIISNTNSSGQAGSIGITAGQGITLNNNSQISARTSNTGPAGDITLNAPILTVAGNAQVLAETQGSGQGGSILVNAPIAVNLMRVQDFSPVLSVEASDAGKAGNIVINTPSLTLADLARITATSTATATNPAGGGSITLNASNLYLAGIVGVFAETQGQAPAGTLRLNPYRDRSDLNITLTPSSRISASTSGSGNGGDLIMIAPRSIALSGPGQLAVSTSSTGNAGNINVATQELTLTDGVELSASTSNQGAAGSINVTADRLTLSQGARISTSTSDSGAAGNLIVNVKDRLVLTGSGTGLFASTTPGSTGNGGNITIDPQVVLIQDRATIAVDSQGQGTGGNIQIQADKLELRDRGSITAETASAQGGDITLDVRNLLLLRQGSVISTTAGTSQAGGNGGNITLNVPEGFIVAVPQENSDITANAFTGRGGNVQITAQGIFGLQFRPQLTLLSDITASSQFGVSGTVTLNTLNVDPGQGLVALPTELVDPSRLIVQRCVSQRNSDTTSSFYIIGRGGLPYRPGDLPSSQFSTATVRPTVEATAITASTPQPSNPPELPLAIIEATKWTRDASGHVFLVTHATTAPVLKVPECPSVAP